MKVSDQVSGILSWQIGLTSVVTVHGFNGSGLPAIWQAGLGQK